ncbi:MAG: AAA family ATPase [Desulfurococcaceae archaeon]
MTTPSPSKPSSPSSSSSSFSDIEASRKRVLEIYSKLNTLVIGHEEMIKAILISAVAREHVVMIGPPGTAKSYTIHTFAKLVNASFYQYLLTKFTTYDELFGPVDILAMTRGEYKRNWSKIVSADFVFLDEIFKANSAILNSLLSLMQERIVYDPFTGAPISAKLISLIGASNETPEDPEIQALFDRFSIKIFIDYISDDAAFLRALQSRWLNNNNNLSPVATLDDINTLSNYSIEILRSNIKGIGEVLKLYHLNVVSLVKSLRARGVIVSDRTIIEKMPKIFAAYLAIYGVTIDNIMYAPYEIIMWVARTKSELNDIKKALDESLAEVAELAKKLEKAKEMLRAMNLAAARKEINDILAFDMSKLASKPWLKPKAEAIIATAKEYLRYIMEFEERLTRLAEG